MGPRAGRLVLLAADATGYRSLCRIISLRHDVNRAPGGPPLADDPVALAAGSPEGLFLLTDDAAVLERVAVAGCAGPDRLGALLVRPRRDDERPLRDAAARRRVPPVADTDVVFLDRGDDALHRLNLAIRLGRPMRDVGAEADDAERWLRPPGEAESLFADVPEAVAAAKAIAEACRFELGGGARLPPEWPGPLRGRPSLEARCRAALDARRARARAWTAAHEARLRHELDVVERTRFDGLVHAVADVVEHCHEEAIPVLTRGSAAGSLVLHVLGASPIDPVASGLLFERFLHEGKSKWPDVDLDLPWNRRDAVVEWAAAQLGDGAALVGVLQRFQRRSALREGLRACGIGPGAIEALVRALPPDELATEEADFLDVATGPVPRAAEDAAWGSPVAAPTWSDSSSSAPATLPDALALVRRLVGRPRHVAAHPGGLLLAPASVRGTLPLERAPKGVVVTQYDAGSLEELGLVKLDLLGSRALAEIDDVLRATGDPATADAIPADDPAALALVDDARTIGCFQLESPAMRSLLAQLPIGSEGDVVAALALVRPGAAAGAAKSTFVRRARGVPVPRDHPFLFDRLRDTHGVLVYEEDAIELLAAAGGLDLGEADELRAAIVRSAGDEAALASLEGGFVERARAAHGPAPAHVEDARRAFAAAARFAAYSFSRAHAASYARVGLQCAWAKARHPVAFACALVEHHGGLYSRRTLAGEVARMGVRLVVPHVNVARERPLAGDGAVHLGLGSVRGLSSRARAAIVSSCERDGPFATLGDLLSRVRLSGRERAALVLAGAADELPPLAADAYPFAHEVALERLARGAPLAEVDALRAGAAQGVEPSRVRLYQGLVRARNELRYLEMAVTADPMALLRPEAERHRCVPLRSAAALAGRRLRVAANVAALKHVATRAGPMLFLTLEDETGLLEATTFPPEYVRLSGRVTTPGPYVVEGLAVRRHGHAYLDVREVQPFHERPRPFDGR